MLVILLPFSKYFSNINLYDNQYNYFVKDEKRNEIIRIHSLMLF